MRPFFARWRCGGGLLTAECVEIWTCCRNVRSEKSIAWYLVALDIRARRRISRQQECKAQVEAYKWIGQNTESKSYIRMNLI